MVYTTSAISFCLTSHAHRTDPLCYIRNIVYTLYPVSELYPTPGESSITHMVYVRRGIIPFESLGCSRWVTRTGKVTRPVKGWWVCFRKTIRISRAIRIA